jgi:hypothetical protein
MSIFCASISTSALVARQLSFGGPGSTAISTGSSANPPANLENGDSFTIVEGGGQSSFGPDGAQGKDNHGNSFGVGGVTTSGMVAGDGKLGKGSNEHGNFFGMGPGRTSGIIPGGTMDRVKGKGQDCGKKKGGGVGEGAGALTFKPIGSAGTATAEPGPVGTGALEATESGVGVPDGFVGVGGLKPESPADTPTLGLEITAAETAVAPAMTESTMSLGSSSTSVAGPDATGGGDSNDDSRNALNLAVNKTVQPITVAVGTRILTGSVMSDTTVIPLVSGTTSLTFTVVDAASLTTTPTDVVAITGTVMGGDSPSTITALAKTTPALPAATVRARELHFRNRRVPSSFAAEKRSAPSRP